jgi:ADP-ribosylglycohydrolase
LNPTPSGDIKGELLGDFVTMSEDKPKLVTSNIANPKEQSAFCLLGAVSGDVIGSVYEFSRQKKYDFPLFGRSSKITDDSVLTIAVADAILSRRGYLECIREYAQAYPNSGYGGYFRKWMYSRDPRPYNSFGNGSAMRVSSVGWAFETIEEVLSEAERSAAVTHNHPEGIKGAQAVALSVFLARKGRSKEGIKLEIISRFGYVLDKTLDEIRPAYEFNETCQETVPQAIIVFLESDDFEDAIRKAVSLGGDADTLAAITGSIAEAYYGGVPQAIVEEVSKRVPEKLWDVIEEFSQKFAIRA